MPPRLTATYRRRLTTEEWATACRRWEGDPREGFDWLAQELRAAFKVDISRQAVAKAGAKGRWSKGGEPSTPLAVVAQPVEVVAQASATTATSATSNQKPATEVVDRRGNIVRPMTRAQREAAAAAPADRVVAEPVDLPPGEKPVGYAGTGRPSSYRPEYDQMIIDYFSVEPTKEVEVTGFGGATKVQIVPVPPPMLVKFAHGIGVSVDTLGRWANDIGDDGKARYPGFAESYARARQLLEGMLVQGAALGIYDGRVTQFVLKNWYGWKDQPDKDVEVEPVSRELLETRYVNIMAAARERMQAMREERARLRREQDAAGV